MESAALVKLLLVVVGKCYIWKPATMMKILPLLVGKCKKAFYYMKMVKFVSVAKGSWTTERACYLRCQESTFWTH